jgi:hypothetical protein
MIIVSKSLAVFMDENRALSKQGRASRRQGFADFRWIERKAGRPFLLLTFFFF